MNGREKKRYDEGKKKKGKVDKKGKHGGKKKKYGSMKGSKEKVRGRVKREEVSGRNEQSKRERIRMGNVKGK